MSFRNFKNILLVIFLKLLNIRCEEKSSLTFVIDDTSSMRDDIHQVRQAVDGIMDISLSTTSSQINEIVLVTFNDPDVKLIIKTKNRRLVKKKMDSISVHNGYNPDCAEMALSGIELALRESQPGSYLYVFTDASAKDYKKLNIIKSLCQRKQSQVFFVLTGHCGGISQQGFLVYHTIVAACSGQVMLIKKTEVNSVLETVKEITLGKQTLLVWRVISRSFYFQPIHFTIDDKTEYVLVSATGLAVNTYITYYNYKTGPASKKITWLGTAKVLKLTNPNAGVYTAWVKGNSPVSVAIYARTDFLFQHFFSEVKRTSLGGTSKQPVAGNKYYLSISVTDPDHSVKINTVQILDMSDKVYMEMPLRKTSADLYVTDILVSPTITFRIKVIGTVIKTGKTIARYLKTPIEPIIPVVTIKPKMPDVNIKEGSKTFVAYGSSFALTCKVSAYPQATILWRNSKGNILPSTVHIIATPYDYISTLSLFNVKSPAKYTCWANNNYGSSLKTIDVNVQSPFVIKSHPAETTKGKYSKKLTLRCDITSSAPMKINWYRSNERNNIKEEITAPKYIISSDGVELKIKSLNLDLVGEYTCKASLFSDKNNTIVFNTDVRISDLAVPVIDKSTTKITVRSKEPVTIRCKAEGNPKPNISWQFKRTFTDKFLPISGSDAELHIANTELIHSGYYECTARNVAGNDQLLIELNVEAVPVIDKSTTKITVRSKEPVTISCKAEGNPKPNISWQFKRTFTDKFLPISGSDAELHIANTELIHSGYYECTARNVAGNDQLLIELNVEAVPVIDKSTTKITVRSKEPVTISCKAEGNPKPNISWQFKRTFTDKFLPISGSDAELHIANTELIHSGYYECTARNVAGNDQLLIELNVEAVPVIDKSTTKITVRSKEPVTISCKAEGNPKPNISWQFKRTLADKFLPVSGSDAELHIAKTELKHSGYYECTARNVAGNDQLLIELNVEAPPKIDLTNNTRVHEAVEGDAILIIPCNVIGNPKPTVSWKKEGITVETDKKYSLDNGALVIRNLITDDTHNYTCEAKNKLGTDRYIFDGIVTPFLDSRENYGNHYNVYAILGESKNITCLLPHTMGDSVSWYLEGMYTNVTGSNFYLKNATLSNDGNYTCRVSSNVESKSETYDVEVGFPPKFVQTYYSPIIDWNGDPRGEVNCDVEAKPQAKVVWLVNGKLADTDTLQLAISGWGNYTCQVNNVHGTVNRTFSVTSTSCLINRTAESTAHTPLLLDETTSRWPVFESQHEFMIVNSKETFKLMCPSQNLKPNSFEIFSYKSQIVATCDQKDRFIVDGLSYKFSELRCKEQVFPVVIRTGAKCLNDDTELLRVGFEVDDFIETYEVCFDTSKSVPLSTRVNMSIINIYNDKAEHNKWYNYPGIGDGKIGKEYTCENSSSVCCYAKCQLVNARDVSFGPAETSTYIDHLNAIPVWRPCADTPRISWEKLEESVRSELKINPQFTVWSGVSKVFDKYGGNIPRYLWKVFRYDDVTSAAIVYVNDPMPVDSDILCENICGGISVPWMDNADRFTYCCNVEDFLKAFDIPKNIVIF